jgi:hypothetical protein
MSPKKQPEEQPRREKENMDEPQEEFIDISSVPSRPKQMPSKPESEEDSDDNEK